MRIDRVAASLLMALACAGSACTASAPSRPSPAAPAPGPRAPVRVAVLQQPARARCPAQPQGGFGLGLRSLEGPAESALSIAGAVPHYRENGSYDRRGERIEVWWNVARDDWELLTPGSTRGPGPASAGPVVQLAGFPTGTACRFAARLRLPQVAAGAYPVMVIQAGDGSAALYDGFTFRVTA